MDTCPTIRIKADNAQGFAIINEGDLDTTVHALFGAEPEADLKLSVAEIREALTAKGIDIPEGAKKADLRALLDAAK